MRGWLLVVAVVVGLLGACGPAVAAPTASPRGTLTWYPGHLCYAPAPGEPYDMRCVRRP